MNQKDVAGSRKAPLRLVPPALMIAASGPMQDGANKYGPYDWRQTPISVTKHLEAAMRHILAYSDGEDDAPDSGYSHLAHAVAALGVILDAQEFGTLIDDRVTGPAGQMLERIHRKMWVKSVREVDSKGNIVREIEVPAPEDELPLSDSGVDVWEYSQKSELHAREGDTIMHHPGLGVPEYEVPHWHDPDTGQAQILEDYV